MSYGVGHKRSSDLALLWLWCRLAATALIRPLAWEPPYATGAALKNTKRKERAKLFTDGASPAHLGRGKGSCDPTALGRSGPRGVAGHVARPEPGSVFFVRLRKMDGQQDNSALLKEQESRRCPSFQGRQFRAPAKWGRPPGHMAGFATERSGGTGQRDGQSSRRGLAQPPALPLTLEDAISRALSRRNCVEMLGVILLGAKSACVLPPPPVGWPLLACGDRISGHKVKMEMGSVVPVQPQTNPGVCRFGRQRLGQDTRGENPTPPCPWAAGGAQTCDQVPRADRGRAASAAQDTATQGVQGTGP